MERPVHLAAAAGGEFVGQHLSISSSGCQQLDLEAGA
jgi:hypothetical protein